MLFFFVTIYCFSIVNSYNFITKTQWKSIQHYICSDLTTIQRYRLNNAIFYCHLPLVYSNVYSFIRFHPKKCRNMMKDDLIFYGYKGLYQSIKKYNGKYNFVKFSKIYIRGSLYTGLTKHYQISKLCVTERKKSVNCRKIPTNTIQNKNFYLDKLDFLKSNIVPLTNTNDYVKIWKKINKLPLFTRRLFYEKFDFLFEKKKTNLEISKKMNCSEEWVRRCIHNQIKNLTKDSCSLIF